MMPVKDEYRLRESNTRARVRKHASNRAEMPHPVPASFGVETADADTPFARRNDIKSSVCERDENTASIVMIITLPSYNRISFLGVLL